MVNHGATAQTYDLAHRHGGRRARRRLLAAGRASRDRARRASVEIDVQMAADAAQMDHAREATVAATQAAPAPLAGLGGPRAALADRGGRLSHFQPEWQPQLRVPLYAAARPASAMAAPGQSPPEAPRPARPRIPLTGTERLHRHPGGRSRRAPAAFPTSGVAGHAVRAAGREPAGSDQRAALRRYPVRRRRLTSRHRSSCSASRCGATGRRPSDTSPSTSTSIPTTTAPGKWIPLSARIQEQWRPVCSARRRRHRRTLHCRAALDPDQRHHHQRHQQTFNLIARFCNRVTSLRQPGARPTAGLPRNSTLPARLLQGDDLPGTARSVSS